MNNNIENKIGGIENNKLLIDNNLNKLKENINIENFPKITDICSENTEGYCNKLNLSLNDELKNHGINFKETYFKVMKTEISV